MKRKNNKFNDSMRQYILTTVREELCKKHCNQADATGICEDFINDPEKRQSIIDEWELESIRICDHCGKPMYEGYMWEDFNTYCSKKCVKEANGWPDSTFEEYIKHAEEENAALYWTKWEG